VQDFGEYVDDGGHFAAMVRVKMHHHHEGGIGPIGQGAEEIL